MLNFHTKILLWNSQIKEDWWGGTKLSHSACNQNYIFEMKNLHMCVHIDLKLCIQINKKKISIWNKDYNLIKVNFLTIKKKLKIKANIKNMKAKLYIWNNSLGQASKLPSQLYYNKAIRPTKFMMMMMMINK